ncbi:MAG: cardiolipin synthase [Desulfovibrionales bacterium]|nr:cardiolipin synthase [Desulfovibrionales bacterium]
MEKFLLNFSEFILAHLELLVGFLLAAAFAVKAVMQRRSPSGAIAWLLIILLAPYVGVPLYFIFGGRKIQKQARRKGTMRLSEANLELKGEIRGIDQLLRAYDIPGACDGARVQLLTTGEQIYETLARQIDEASKSCWIMTFILTPDPVGLDIIDRLARKAAQGLDVRLLVDDLGSLRLSYRHVEPLIKAGGRFATFMPVLHLPFRGQTNLRNHRKIAIFDGSKVIAGGTNIATEYIGPAPRAGRWKDLSFLLEGPAVRHYAEIFAEDWSFATGVSLEIPTLDDDRAGDAVVQVVPSGPDVEGDPLHHAELSALFAARESILVVTPYFVPDESLSLALALAARRGVETTLIVPLHSNKKLLDMVRSTYMRQIMQAGAKVLLYQPTMIHAKVLVVDDRLAMVGSANMDMRSLFLNFEAMLLMYSKPDIQAVRQWINSLSVQCVEADLRPVGKMREFSESATRLLAPLL